VWELFQDEDEQVNAHLLLLQTTTTTKYQKGVDGSE